MKPTRCYTKPNAMKIFLNRNCSRCCEAHFNFEHYSFHATARFGFDESGYEEWDCDSDTVDMSSSLWVTQDSSVAPWSDDVAASSPDWRLSGTETVWQQSHLWHPQEDEWLCDKKQKPLSASDRAHRSMDLHLQHNPDAELRELHGVTHPAPLADSVTDPNTLYTWVAKSMPPLRWPSLDDNWDSEYRAFFSHHRPRITPRPHSWSQSPNDGCRHPDDHVIVASPNLPVQEDGRCFLCSTLTFFRPWVGSSRAPRTRAHLDNCANLCLANKDFLLRCMAAVTIHEDFTTGVDGIGSARTVGYVHAPIYIDCMSRVGGKVGKVELNLEIL